MKNDYGKTCEVYLNPNQKELNNLCKSNKNDSCRGCVTKDYFFAFDHYLVHEEFLRGYLESPFSNFLTREDYRFYIQAFFKDKDVKSILNVPIEYSLTNRTWTYNETVMTTPNTVRLIKDFLDKYWSNLDVFIDEENFAL